MCMQKLFYKPILFVVFLPFFYSTAICEECCPPCEECYVCVEEECVPKVCGPHYVCDNDECVCAEECCKDSDCGPCEHCVNYHCVYQCSEDQCCHRGTCVPKCNPNGDGCYFYWPPVQTPSTNCQSLDPTDLSCPPGFEGLICAWVQTKAYHTTSAKCADCASGCKEYSGEPCVELTPLMCHNQYIFTLGFVCMCNEQGYPGDAGQHYKCK